MTSLENGELKLDIKAGTPYIIWFQFKFSREGEKNNGTVLILGESGAGKSCSLRNFEKKNYVFTM